MPVRNSSRALWLAAVAMLSMVASLLIPLTPAAAAQTFNISGTWNSVYHCVSGWCAGQDFPSPGGVFIQAKGSTHVTEPGGDHGTISGHVLTLHGGSPGGYEYDAVLTFAADGKSWTGTLTDSNHTSGTDTGVKVGTPASLSISVHPTVPKGGLGLGDSLSVPVTVTATDGDVSDITFGDSPTVSGPAVAITKSPVVPKSFDLKAGTSRTFTFTVKAVAKGTSSFDASVDGDDNGRTLSASDSEKLTSSARVLKITIASTPGTVDLAADDDGKISPTFISVRVKLTNASKTLMKDVQLLSLRPVPVHPSEQLDQLAFAKGLLPLTIGTIQPGANLVKTFKLRVTGDGEYVFDALAIYGDPSAPSKNARATAHTGEFTATVPLLYLKAAREGSGQVRGGDAWYVTGHVKNLSSFQTLCLSPLSPDFSGNAGGVGPHQIGVVPVDDPAPPLAGPLAPGKTLSFLMAVHTDADGTTHSFAALKPRASLGDPGDSCNVLTTDQAKPIAAKKIKIAKDSEKFDASVDNSAPAPAGAGALEFFGSYAKGSYKTLAETFESCAALANEYGSVDKLVAAMKRLDPEGAYARAAAALGNLSHATSIVASFWINASPAEQDAFLQAISDDFTAQTHEVWDGVQAAVQKSARGWFDNVVRAYYSGDSSAMFSALGESSGSGLTEAALETAKWEVGFAILKKGAAFTKVAVRVGEESVLIKALKDMPAGKILKFEELERLWGLTKTDFLAFQQVAEEEGVLIGVRGRSPVSVKNLEEGAVWKHENIKPKNVNDIDTTFLGFEEKDTGAVAFRTYTNKEKASILKNIERAGLDADTKAAVLDRASTRFGEKKYLSSIQGYSDAGQIDVGFSYRGNGLDLDPTSAPRKFHLDAEKVKGGTYYRPLQENPALDGLAEGGNLPSMCKAELSAVLCRITGDMDGVYIVNKGGTSLSETQRLTVYRKLAAAGWQHPETLTWMKGDGSFFFGAKKKILAGLEVGGEPMIEFGTDGIQRATYFDLSKSYLFSKDSYYIDIVGGEYQP